MSAYPPPQENWAGGHNGRRPSSSSTVPAMFAGAIIFALGGGLGLIAGWLLASITPWTNLLDQYADCAATVTITTPDAISVGEPFDLILTVTETSGEGRTVYNVDLSGPIASGYTLIATDPAYTATDDYGQSDYLEIALSAPIPANGSAQITLTLAPTAPGATTSDIDLYFDECYGSVNAAVTLDPVGASQSDPDF